MPNLPTTVNIDLQDLSLLLGYYWSSVNSEVGDLGTKTYEETLLDISRQSQCKVTPSQLESLVYHMKQAIFEKLKPVHVDLRLKNYQKIMKRLADDIPQLFKQEESGETVFINFEDKKSDS